MKKIKVKVVKKFLDLDTGILRKPDDPKTNTMMISNDRYLELYRTGKGYVEVVKDNAPLTAPKTDKVEVKK